MDDGNEDLIKESYCNLKPKATDTFKTLNYFKINNNKIEIYKIEKTNWIEAYKCLDDQDENCGDITKVDCNSDN